MDRTRLGIGVLGAALALGLLGDVLLRAIPWGINFPLWVLALSVAVAGLMYWGGVAARGEGWWLLPFAGLSAAFVAWRDAPMLVFLNLLVVLASLSLAALRWRSGSIRRSGISEYLLGGLYTGLCAGAGPVPAVLTDVEWREVTPGRWQAPTLAVTRGVLLATPLLLLFGGLFVAADAVFEGVVRDLLAFDVEEVLGHLFLIILIVWISAGSLRLALLGSEPAWTSLRRPGGLALGVVEIGIVLGLLNLLFFAFVAVQVRYLFGGAATATGLTYAEYARRGFFELLLVTALVVPLLLLTHWLFRSESRTRTLTFKALAAALVVQLFVIVASALQRMRLYTQEFGLTELRFYATAFMIWLTLVLLWLCITVFWDRRDRFAVGVLAAGFAAVVLLNVVNPAGVIVRTNVARMEEGKRFDPYYLSYLGADAVPALVKSLPKMESDDRRIVKEELQYLAEAYEDEDWRSWNHSRAQADHLIQDVTKTDGRPAENLEEASR